MRLKDLPQRPERPKWYTLGPRKGSNDKVNRRYRSGEPIGSLKLSLYAKPGVTSFGELELKVSIIMSDFLVSGVKVQFRPSSAQGCNYSHPFKRRESIAMNMAYVRFVTHLLQINYVKEPPVHRANIDQAILQDRTSVGVGSLEICAVAASIKVADKMAHNTDFAPACQVGRTRQSKG
jgi:hypothetical protein